MKKFTIFAVAAMIISYTANAQDIAIGVKAGLNLANISDFAAPSAGTGISVSPGTRVGAHIGPFVKLPISDNFSIIPELLYSMKGAEISESILGFNFEMKTKLDYLEIPIMANYELDNGLNFELGPYVGILLSAKSSVDFFGISIDDVDIKEGMNTLDFGLGFGAGYRLENGLGFGARYSLGLATLFKEADVIATDIDGDPIIDPATGQPMIVKQDAYGKNSNIMISVSWLFGQN